MSIIKFLLVGSVGFASLMSQNASAYADDVYATQYRISIIGLTIARANTQTHIGQNDYILKGDFASSGIARIFDQTDGTLSINGKMAKGSFWPSSYHLQYQHKKKAKSTTIRFANGRVTDTKNSPAVKKRDPWVALTEVHLKNISDPISAMMIRAKSPQDVCAQVLKTFDGQTRADLRLTYSGKGKYSTKGFKGETVECTARFVPLGGYQKDKESINYLANKSKISISFATLGNSGIYAPVEARIGTKIGTVKVSATRFEKVN
ncbi:DUF3108 domain-containing protein [Paenochrobactrum sp. BZR 588]|uniref:DUF3108 domain-containing protein n=1 Tax=Paenochrobactrum TaxID=999488 RepID=UPI0035BC6C08